MEKKINVAELLKDCPNGMELDCALYDNLIFDHIDDNGYFPIICRVKTKIGYNVHTFTEHGCYSTINYSKCVIYPKGKTTWEGFQRPFKDGDIITCTNSMCSFVAIFKEQLSDKAFKRYAVLTLDKNPIFKSNINTSDFIRPRFATEEEQEKLFDAIKAKGFKWNAETKTMEIEPKFKDGDIIYIKTKGDSNWLSIYKELDGRNIRTYADVSLNENLRFYCDYVYGNIVCYKEEVTEQRLATEEEKQKLFQVIKANGFKWNAKTKTMENLVELNFNDGDIIYTKIKGYGKWLSIYKGLEGRNIRTYVDIVLDNKMSCYCNLLTGNILCYKEDVIEQRLATEEEKQKLFQTLNNNYYKWNAETNTMKKITAKFKVGDKVKCIFNNYQYIITELTDTHYTLVETISKFKYTEPIIEDKNWELVPNKFDITTLKQFDKVLARDCNDDKWNIDFFGYYKGNGIYQCMTFTKNQCIPYDGNEHLLGTTDDCDEFYKTWK